MTNNATRIDGLDDLEKALRDFGPMMQGKKGYPKNPLRTAARTMAKAAKANAETRVPVATGRLQKAITIKLMSAKYRDVVTAKGDSVEFYYLGAKSGKSRSDTDGAYYARFVEVGTANMSARPFLRPAVEEHQSQLIGAFKDNLSKSMEGVRKKLNNEGLI